MKWLQDVIGCSQAGGLDRRFDRPILRQHHRRHVRKARSDSFQQFQSAKLRNLQVRQQYVHRRALHQIQRLLGGPGRVDLKPDISRDFSAQTACRAFVIHNQHSQIASLGLRNHWNEWSLHDDLPLSNCSAKSERTTHIGNDSAARLCFSIAAAIYRMRIYVNRHLQGHRHNSLCCMAMQNRESLQIQNGKCSSRTKDLHRQLKS